MTEKKTPTVREFSSAGPCLTLGPLVKRTAKTFTYNDRIEGGQHRVGGWKVQSGHFHTDPCRSCRDHDATMYPEGYMD